MYTSGIYPTYDYTSHIHDKANKLHVHVFTSMVIEVTFSWAQNETVIHAFNRV